MVTDPAAPLSIPSAGRVPEGPATHPRRPDPGSSAPAAEPVAPPAEPTAGDSSLWDLLTSEERTVLERHAGLGSLTYRPNGRPGSELPVPTGRRIDIRG